MSLLDLYLTVIFCFVFGVIVTAIGLPALSKDYPSEIVSVEFTNETTQSMECIVAMPNGRAVTAVVDPESQSSLIIHEGEYYDTDFPSSMRTIILDGSGEVVFNNVQVIEVQGTESISIPSGFVIMLAEDGEIVVMMSRLRIDGWIVP